MSCRCVCNASLFFCYELCVGQLVGLLLLVQMDNRPKKKWNHNFGTELIDHIDVCDFMSPDKIRACILIRSSGVINCIYNFFTICDNNN